MNAKRIFYTGHVQGVGFRFSVKQIVAGFDICGTVRNLPDGRVELFVQGDVGEVNDLISEVDQSHLNGFIKQREETEVAPDPAIRGFSILR
ncbi:MAG: acylphosphatase [Verrucomicrobiota bacterium]